MAVPAPQPTARSQRDGWGGNDARGCPTRAELCGAGGMGWPRVGVGDTGTAKAGWCLDICGCWLGSLCSILPAGPGFSRERVWEKGNWIILGKKKKDKLDLIKNMGFSFNLKAVASLPQHVLGAVRWRSRGSRTHAACPAMGPRILSCCSQGMYQPGEEEGKVCSSKWCDLTVHWKGKRYGRFFGF